jgi:N-acetylglucosaminyldiphosphoundecaprenol N-acetyl-beta-D-mannosaminyltransferase
VATTSLRSIAVKNIDLHGMEVASIDSAALVEHVFSALGRGEGGWIVTANLDILRRYAQEREARELYDAADLRVADGMPLVWASRVQREPLPERVAGSTLVWQLAERAAREGKSIYLLGGDEGAGEGAAREMVARYPGLRIAGLSAPRVSLPPRDDEMAGIAADIAAANPDIVYVGFGSPKQEYICRGLRARFPSLWVLGIGISLSFMAGQVKRAPPILQKLGLEWTHRLVQEPKRLARRYLIDDIPFALSLFRGAMEKRARG